VSGGSHNALSPSEEKNKKFFLEAFGSVVSYKTKVYVLPGLAHGWVYFIHSLSSDDLFW
jgi:hypothetical protein